MTSNLPDLIQSTFHLAYSLHMSPVDVDKLSTYEMREYMALLSKKQSKEAESESSMLKTFMQLLGLRRKL